MKPKPVFYKIIAYTLAFVLPPLIIGVMAIAISFSELMHGHPEPFSTQDVHLPNYDRHKQTAVILVSNEGTEITDLLVPYEIFSASGKFNVYTVAPKRQILPLNGGVDLIPHFSFAEFEQNVGAKPDLIVIPAVHNWQDPTLINWIIDRHNEPTVILSICEGARLLAATGLLENHQATTHWLAIDSLKKDYPDTAWVKDVKYVEDGNIITSPGVITGAMNGSLYTLEKLAGKTVAREVAHKLNYPFTDSAKFNQQSSEFGIRPTGSTVCSTGGTPATQLSHNSELGYLSSNGDKPLPSEVLDAEASSAYRRTRRKEFGRDTSLFPSSFNSELRTKNSELERSDFDSPSLELKDSLWLLTAAYQWHKQNIGVFLNDGIDEINLTAVLDTYPRSFTARTKSITPERKVINSRYGLNLVPRHDFATTTKLDRLLVLDNQAHLNLETWAKNNNLEPEYLSSLSKDAGRFIFDNVLEDLAQQTNKSLTKIVAKTVEFPVNSLNLAVRDVPIWLFLRPLAIALISLVAIALLDNQYSHITAYFKRFPITKVMDSNKP